MNEQGRRSTVVLGCGELLTGDLLAHFLECNGHFQVVGRAREWNTLVTTVAQTLPEVVILVIPFLGMPPMERGSGSLGGGVFRVVLVVETLTPAEVEGFLRSGVSGVLLKDSHGVEIVDALRAIEQGDIVLPGMLRGNLPPHGDMEGAPGDLGGLALLSERERDIVRMMADGMGNPAIAAELEVGLRTLYTHLRHIYGKLGARSSAHAVSRAMKLGVLPLWEP